MPVRSAQAVWEGSLQEGMGRVLAGSGALNAPYSFGSRFEKGEGTTPEELIGAAHAGCFSMAMSGALGRAGFTPQQIRTTARVSIEKVNQEYEITGIELSTEVRASGIDEARFQQIAKSVGEECPVSKALKNVPVKLTAHLSR